VAVCVVGFGGHFCWEVASLASIGIGTVIHWAVRWYDGVVTYSTLSETGHLANGLSLAALIVDQSAISLSR
jgi:hypothetical protein